MPTDRTSGPPSDRRDFLKSIMAAGVGMGGLHPAIARALAIPAHNRTGTIKDVEHVVILTQENRAFDHYFGSLHGVQGFADRFVLPARDLGARSAQTVFVQPHERGADRPAGEPALIAPFHLNTRQCFGVMRHDGTPHGFADGQAAWDNGRITHWTKAKTNHAMGYFTQDDLPFQYALANAFSLCDAYFCAMHLSTTPNRLYIWTGTHDPAATGHGPALDNAYEDFSDPYKHGGYTWTTYPERLLQAGISFRVYQDMKDNFGDNPLQGFRQYRDALKATDGAQAELAQRTLTTRDLGGLKADVRAGALPQISWIVGPELYSEHPGPSSPAQGAEYIAQVLDALTANPDVWSKTVLLINFDENDGLFDHVPPPSPPARDPGDPSSYLGGSTVSVEREYHEHSQDEEDAAFLHRAYGLGPRVPLYVISPWSKGGYVASEVFDHTSILRFLEARFGVIEPNITPWRRAVCGDLTSCFNFATPNDRPFMAGLPETLTQSEKVRGMGHTRPVPPEALTAPVQAPGLRRRRPAPYVIEAALHRDDATAAIGIRLSNDSARAAAVFHLYDLDDLAAIPRRYTVGADRTMIADVPLHDGAYRVFLLGPGGFHRRFEGKARPSFTSSLVHQGASTAMQIRNLNATPIQVTMEDQAYGRKAQRLTLAAHQQIAVPLDLRASHHWYDYGLSHDGQTARLAGHVENGEDSYSDPAASGTARLRFS